MHYKLLGKTGVHVSALCFGTMSFGGDADAKTSSRMFHLCRDAGINFFDCADMYQKGEAERILGKLVRSCRDEVILATKAYFPMGEDLNARGATRLHLLRAVEASLRRLGTDRIDVFYVHRFDELTPLEETMRTLDDLVHQGKILYPGASNFAAWQVMKGLGISEHRGWSPFYVIQPMYNLIKRQAEVEILPMAQAEGLGVCPYSPLAAGLLSGKYGVERRPPQGRLVENPIYQARYGQLLDFQIAEAFVHFASEAGYEPAALAVAWVASHPAVTAPILGARNPEQLAVSLRALEIPMTPELRARISCLSPEPPPPTDRIEERLGIHHGVREATPVR